ncbi:MAG: alpha-ribazole phosphatase [Pseudomonadota bacterium]
MALILLRHTRPAIAAGICYGRSDLDLAPGFKADADRLALSLPPVSRIVTSPLRRCARLAEHIGAARGLPVDPEPRLSEMDFGAWEGVAWDAIPRAELDAWAADFLHARPHGGETVAMLLARVAAALSALADAGGDTLIVAHAGVIKAALVAHGDKDGWEARPAFGEIRRIDSVASR